MNDMLKGYPDTHPSHKFLGQVTVRPERWCPWHVQFYSGGGWGLEW